MKITHSFYDMDAARQRIDSSDDKLSVCSKYLKEVEEEITNCEQIRETVVSDFKSCNHELSTSAEELQNNQERVVQCINALKSLSSKYTGYSLAVSGTMATLGVAAAVGTVAVATGPVGIIVGTIAALAGLGWGGNGLLNELVISRTKEKLYKCEEDLKKCDNVVATLKDVLKECTVVIQELQTILEDIVHINLPNSTSSSIA